MTDTNNGKIQLDTFIKLRETMIEQNWEVLDRKTLDGIIKAIEDKLGSNK